MTYEEFKAFVSTFLWKDTDTSLTDNLDNLVRLGANTLNRRLYSLFRDRTIDVALVGPIYELPADYREIIAVTCTDAGVSYRGAFKFLPLQDMLDKKAKSGDTQWLPYYSIRGNNLVLTGPDTPANLSITYKAQIPDKDDPGGNNWWFDDYLDAFLYATLISTAGFLREDERIQQWSALYNNAISEIEEEYHFGAKQGRPDSFPLGAQAGVNRR